MPRPSTHFSPLAFIRKYGALCIVLLTLVYCVTQAFDPPRLNWGDQESDYNAMTSGENFARVGFFKLRFTPVLLTPHYRESDGPPIYYTHYPPLPDLANGLWRLFGLTELHEFRLVALCFSFGSLLFLYPLLKHYWTKPVADVSIVLWVLNPLWLQHADYLHHYPYCWFFGFGCLYFLLRHLQTQKKRFVALSALFLFLCYLSSYDYWYFIPLLVALMTWHHVGTLKSRRYWAIVLLIGAGAFLAIFTKLGLAAWALGGWDKMLEDLKFQFHERATDNIARTGFRSGAAITILLRVYREYTSVFGPALLFAVMVPILDRFLFRKFKVDVSLYRVNPAILLLVALPFIFSFMELFVGQYYPMLQLLPAYAVTSAVFIVWLFKLGKGSTRAAAAVCLLLMAFNIYIELTVLKKAFMPEPVLARLKKELDTLTPPGRIVITNHDFSALYRYYLSRKLDGVILAPPDAVIRHLVGYPDGDVIFVEHKNIEPQLFDKTHYILFSKTKMWAWYGDPVKYRTEISMLIDLLEKNIIEQVQRVGEKIVDHEEYALWRIKPHAPLPPRKLKDAP